MISFALSMLLLFAEPMDLEPMCTCIAGKSIEEGIESADLIFEGVVLKQERYPENWRTHAGADFLRTFGFGGSVYVFFFATKKWKGSRLHDLVVSTPVQSSMCGFQFKDGEKYLVYAHINESQAMTDICTPTKPAGEAASDRRVLDSLFVD